MNDAEPATPSPENIGRELRLMFLSTPAAEMGFEPSEEFPHVFAVAMDWPIDDQTATVIALSDGSASLYTTSAFGIIGGNSDQNVRAAATDLVAAANRYHSSATPVTEFPYPSASMVRFYLRTYDGVTVIETDASAVYDGVGEFSELFELGQIVLTELHLISEDDA